MVNFVNLSRRTLLNGAILTGAGLVVSPALGKLLAAPAWTSNPFSLGVAAGAPTPNGFVRWTKLAPAPLSDDPAAPFAMSGPSQPVSYEIAIDDSMHHIVQRGTAIAAAEFGHSVHQQVRGLKPGRPY